MRFRAKYHGGRTSLPHFQGRLKNRKKVEFQKDNIPYLGKSLYKSRNKLQFYKFGHCHLKILVLWRSQNVWGGFYLPLTRQTTPNNPVRTRHGKLVKFDFLLNHKIDQILLPKWYNIYSKYCFQGVKLM